MMQRPRMLQPLVLMLVVLVGSTAVARGEQGATRWDLTDLYQDTQAWRSARGEVQELMEQLTALQGTLGEGPQALKQALDLVFELQKQAMRLHVYASLLSDIDVREPGPQGMKQELGQQLAELRAQGSWVEPEILALPTTTISEYLEAEPGLAVYRRYLEQLERQRAHRLDTEGEKILGMSALLRGDSTTIGAILRNAEIPWKTITLSDGSELKVDPSGYMRGRASNNRTDRIASYDAFYSELAAFQQTLATTLAATVKGHLFIAKTRHYPDTLTAALDEAEIDPAVYHRLVAEVNQALPTLHRYLKLRARMLGIDDLAYHDLYPQLVGEVETAYPWEEAKEQVLAAFAPMGEEYVEYLRHAWNSGWVDVFPREGKPAGAYVSGAAYDVHPYMLLNHQDNYDTTSTLAHESGHMMHSALSNKAQPFPTARYATFVAEVASTTQEWLFFHYSLEHARSDDERLVILGSFLERMRQTVFRQTMFAEFELAMHQLVENGQAITADSLNSLYLDLLKRYHGDAEGVCHIDDKYQVEWAFIPHFHYNYYVYTYATSFIAATAFSQQILGNTNGGVERYISELLEAGSSEPPVEILQAAGVDMTTPAPFKASFAAMDEIIDQIEEILAARE